MSTLLGAQLAARPTTQRLILALALHRVLCHIEEDADGFVLRNLPSFLQHLVRHHAKQPADAVVDLAVTMLPLVQPRWLRNVPCTTIELEPGCSLDVCRPESGAALAPVLLFVHGGIWTMGNRTQYRALGQRLAAEGFVGVVVGYNTWPRANASEQARAVQAAFLTVVHPPHSGVPPPHRRAPCRPPSATAPCTRPRGAATRRVSTAPASRRAPTSRRWRCCSAAACRAPASSAWPS